MNRVLMLLCQKASGTGSGTVAREIAKRAAARGLNVTVLCGAATTDSPDKWFDEPRIQVSSVRFGDAAVGALPFQVVGMSNEMPYPSTRFAALSREMLAQYEDAWTAAIRAAVRDAAPDVVHVHHLWLLVRFVRRAAPDRPTLVSIHGTDLQRAVEVPQLRELVAGDAVGVDRILAPTRRTAADARALYNLDEDRISVLPNGFDEEVFVPSENPGRLSTGEYPTPGRRLILFVAKFAPWKGLVYLLKALAALRSRGGHAQLWILGSGPPSDVAAIQQLVRALGLEQEVMLLGHRTQADVAAAMKLAHVFVLPSFEEPFGLVLLEAMASGCRSVAADHGGPAEFVPRAARERGDALLVAGLERFPPSEPDELRYIAALSRAIEDQLAAPLDLADRQRIAASVANVTWARHVDVVLGMYKELAASRAPSGSVS
jgi:glycosyltransferase involved in cell wall biosynthesis